MLVIEAGGQDNYLWVHIPVGYLYCIGNPRTDWLYATEPAAGLNGRSLRYPRGKVLGGSSSINGMIYMRGQARDYDGWGAGDGHGANPGWSWAECLPYFLKHEDFYKGADAFHAAPGFDPTGKRPGGEWRVEKQRLHWPILDAFAAAAEQAGLPRCDDFNRGDNEGVGYFDVNQRAGIRWNATKAFLRPAFPRSNLQVWTGAHIHRVVFDGRPRERRRDRAGSAAASRSRPGSRPAARSCSPPARSAAPQILQLSGIGDRRRCSPRTASHVRAALPGVGANLQDHLQIRAVYGVEGAKTLNTTGGDALGQGDDRPALRLEAQRPDEHGAVAARRLHAQQPGAGRTPTSSTTSSRSRSMRSASRCIAFDAFTASVCNLNPTSRGHVRIRSADAGDAAAHRARLPGDRRRPPDRRRRACA